MANTIRNATQMKSPVFPIVIEESDVVVASGVININFENASVVDEGGNKVTVTCSGGGGGGTPGGEDTQVQVNDGGAFAGFSGFTFNKSSKQLKIGNLTFDPGDVFSAKSITWRDRAGIPAFTDELIEQATHPTTQFAIVIFKNDSSGLQDSGVLIDDLVEANVTITGATKTKITYDSKGLVTAGEDATAADVGAIATIVAGDNIVVDSADPVNPIVSASGLLKLDQTTPQTVVDGRPVFEEGIDFGLAPTVSGWTEGSFYYDALWKSLAIQEGYGSLLIIGQDTFRLVWNGTGSTLLKGKAVYVSGAYTAGSNDVVSVALADASDETKSIFLGLVNEDIEDGHYGFVIITGYIFPVKTDYVGWTAGAPLYLSDVTPGELMYTQPTAGNFRILCGRVTSVGDDTVGKIHVHSATQFKLGGLLDVTTTTPVADDVLRWNGAEWVNGSVIVAGANKGVSFYYNGTEIIATGNDNSNHVETLSKIPWNHAEEVEDTSCDADVDGGVTLGDIYLYDAAVGRETLEAGAWVFICYAAVNLAAGVTECLHNIMRVRPGAGTVTVTGTGTSRTATASEGTPFATAVIDTGGTKDSDSYLRTPLGVYRITARTSNTVVTILVPTTYTNEEAVTFSVHKRLFQASTGEIDNTASSPLYAGIQMYTTNSVQTSFTVEKTDKLAVYRFAKTTSSVLKHLYFAYGGTTRYSRIDTPLATLHGDLAGLQGGTGSVPTEEFYHLTLAQHTGLTGGGETALHSHAGGGAPDPHAILSTSHSDTLADAVIDGDIIIGNVTPKWSKLAISIPAGAALLNVLGVVNGETRPSWKVLFDATNPAMNGSVAPGTATTAAHRDHVHPVDTSRAPLAAPVFTGDAQCVTPAADDNDTSIATTAYYCGQIGTANPAMHGTAAAGTSKKFSPIDHVHPTDLLGDGTAGRKLKALGCYISNGTNASTVKAQSVSMFNGDVNAAQDNIPKNNTAVGNWKLSADGYTLTLLSSGFSGNVVGILSYGLTFNLSGVAMLAQCGISSGGIYFIFVNATTGAYIDISTAVDTGNFNVQVCYVTAA